MLVEKGLLDKIYMLVNKKICYLIFPASTRPKARE